MTMMASALPVSIASAPRAPRGAVPAADRARSWRLIARFALDGWERAGTPDSAAVIDHPARRLDARARGDGPSTGAPAAALAA